MNDGNCETSWHLKVAWMTHSKTGPEILAPMEWVYVGFILTPNLVFGQFWCFGVVVWVPKGLQWSLNQLALENGNDDRVEEWARNPSPSGGVFVGSIWLQVRFLSILMLYSGCEAPLGPPVASKQVCPWFKIELMAPQKKGAKIFFLSKIGHSVMTLIWILIPMNQTWSVYDSLYVELDVDMRCVDHHKVMV